MTGATTTAQGYALTSGEARDHGYNGEARLRYLARAADTDGRVTVFEASGVGPQQGPPLHVHHESDEALLVLEGSVLVQLGEERHELGPGGFAWMPHGRPHAFRIGGGPFRSLGIVTPGGIEDFFAARHTYFESLGGQRPDPARLAEIVAPIGRVVGPPLPVD